VVYSAADSCAARIIDEIKEEKKMSERGA